MKKILIFLMTLLSMNSFSDTDSISPLYIGHYCANPCFYGSIHRPADMLCKFSIKEQELNWVYQKQYVSKKAHIISQDNYSLVIEIDGENGSWHTPASDGTLYQLTFKYKHDNQAAAGDIEFSTCKISGGKCQKLESMFIGQREKFECQEQL